MSRTPRRSLFSSRFGRAFDYVLTVVILALLIFLVSRLDRVAERTNLGRATVHDGDTLTVDGQRIRLRGVDAPEYRQICRRDGKDYGCGREVREALANMVLGKAVTCKGWEKDRYDRLLGTCVAGAPPLDLNREMVRQGWAVSFGDYRAEEADARRRRAGLWAGEFQRPRDWRREHERVAETAEREHGDATGTIWTWLKQLLRS